MIFIYHPSQYMDLFYNKSIQSDNEFINIIKSSLREMTHADFDKINIIVPYQDKLFIHSLTEDYTIYGNVPSDKVKYRSVLEDTLNEMASLIIPVQDTNGIIELLDALPINSSLWFRIEDEGILYTHKVNKKTQSFIFFDRDNQASYCPTTEDVKDGNLRSGQKSIPIIPNAIYDEVLKYKELNYSERNLQESIIHFKVTNDKYSKRMNTTSILTYMKHQTKYGILTADTMLIPIHRLPTATIYTKISCKNNKLLKSVEVHTDTRVIPVVETPNLHLFNIITPDYIKSIIKSAKQNSPDLIQYNKSLIHLVNSKEDLKKIRKTPTTPIYCKENGRLYLYLGTRLDSLVSYPLIQKDKRLYTDTEEVLVEYEPLHNELYKGILLDLARLYKIYLELPYTATHNKEDIFKLDVMKMDIVKWHLIKNTPGITFLLKEYPYNTVDYYIKYYLPDNTLLYYKEGLYYYHKATDMAYRFKVQNNDVTLTSCDYSYIGKDPIKFSKTKISDRPFKFNALLVHLLLKSLKSKKNKAE